MTGWEIRKSPFVWGCRHGQCELIWRNCLEDGVSITAMSRLVCGCTWLRPAVLNANRDRFKSSLSGSGGLLLSWPTWFIEPTAPPFLARLHPLPYGSLAGSPYLYVYPQLRRQSGRTPKFQASFSVATVGATGMEFLGLDGHPSNTWKAKIAS